MNRRVGLQGAVAFCIVGVVFCSAVPAYAQSPLPVAKESSARQELAATQEAQSAPSGIAVDSSVKQASSSSKPEPATAADTSVGVFVTRLDHATRELHETAKKDPALFRKGCRHFLDQIVDLDVMSRAVNVEIWDKMTPSQRETIRTAFEHHMISKCVRQFGNYEGQTLRLAGVRQTQEGNLLATVRVGSDDNAKLVTWRLRGSGSHMRAVDVISEGRSVVSDVRNEFTAVLESANGDITTLIEFLQK